MTIIILEGPEGAGKTSLASRLVKDDKFIRYRALSEGRLSPADTARWRDVGVPVNTLADDVYAADLLCALRSSGRDATRILLDRSLISGCLYWHGGGVRLVIDPGHVWLLDWWANKMGTLGARIVWLDARPDALASRLSQTDARRAPEHLSIVRAGFARLMPYASSLPTLALDTSDMSEDGVYRAVAEWLCL